MLLNQLKEQIDKLANPQANKAYNPTKCPVYGKAVSIHYFTVII